MQAMPNQYERSTIVLNSKNHLCMDGKIRDDDRNWSTHLWCLADLDEATEWIQMPTVYGTDQLKLIGTLPAKIISSMVTAPAVSSTVTAPAV